MPPTSPARNSLRRLLLAMIAALLVSTAALASGPRWVTGGPYFTTGVAARCLVYKHSALLHRSWRSQRERPTMTLPMLFVAAAAAVWNVPTASVTVAQGGRARRAHLEPEYLHWPQRPRRFPPMRRLRTMRLSSSPWSTTLDGSVTDLLLGQGASDPASCRQNAVTESVDAITPNREDPTRAPHPQRPLHGDLLPSSGYSCNIS